MYRAIGTSLATTVLALTSAVMTVCAIALSFYCEKLRNRSSYASKDEDSASRSPSSKEAFSFDNNDQWSQDVASAFAAIV